MIPTDEQLNSFNTNNITTALNSNEQNEQHNDSTFESRKYESHTDKPQMAHEIYSRLIRTVAANGKKTKYENSVNSFTPFSLVNASNSNISIAKHNNTYDKNALLIAYTGCTLRYRN